MFSGLLLALASGISLGGITSFAALSYQHGVVPLELIALRGVIAALSMVDQMHRFMHHTIMESRRRCHD